MKIFAAFVCALLSLGAGEFPQPGAGLKAAPYGADAHLFKDGFYFVSCVTDGMEKFADIHSDQGQKRYAAQNSNVSVVKYHLTVPKGDQVDMTPTVCFNFCRTQDQMTFFGLIHGRECYCTPYYKQEPGDESSCDLPCLGLPTSMCGGKGRSSIYQMHYCGDTAREMEESTIVASKLVEALTATSKALKDCSAAVQEAGDTIGDLAGQIGDSAARDHAQAAREAAGTYKRSQEALDAERGKVISGIKSLENAAPVDQNEQIASLNSAVKAFENAAESSGDVLRKCSGQAPITDAATVLKGFYAVQKFIEGSEGEKATCEGKIVGQPLNLSKEGCASECNQTNFPARCVGFQHYSGDLCILFSEIKKANYYACPSKSFLQMAKSAADADCRVKFSLSKGFRPEAAKFNRCFT